ncbi:MAG: pyridoxamine 5'-phosphate oxidase family protein [Lachnospiraceae bacterium]|nr:pyridoxamine 5'-phosphate oxidase family protein [Lachnospiraceae bacterium]MDE6251788.1 pyridoxamine 5'-phosphate oxidase family protein [Lachnospiraceae bacterium]
MRRNDREIKEFENIVSVMEKCDVCRLAFNTEDYPYILPLNFGMEIEDGKVTLYFHGANEGRKYELMAKDNRVCFEMDCSHRLVTDEESGSCTMEYESVIGQGLVEIVPDEEKYNALCILMKHYHKEEFPFNKNIIPQTTLFKVTVNKVTGKRRMKK